MERRLLLVVVVAAMLALRSLAALALSVDDDYTRERVRTLPSLFKSVILHELVKFDKLADWSEFLLFLFFVVGC